MFIKITINSDNNLYSTADSLIDINTIITGLSYLILRKVNFKPYRCNRVWMNKDSIEDKLYQLIDQFNKRKISHKHFNSEFFENIHLFQDGNGRIL